MDKSQEKKMRELWKDQDIDQLIQDGWSVEIGKEDLVLKKTQNDTVLKYKLTLKGNKR